jgi:protein-S-isoprenylcysteine O-methyltransferase Ste14/uncharacterized caspase-like protein
VVLSVLTLVVCFVVWAVVHSLLASVPFKDWTRRVLGEGVDRWYRLAYVVFASVSGLPLLLMVAVLPDRALYAVLSPWRWLMRGGQVLALGAAVWAVLETGPTYFLGLSQLLARGSGQANTLQVRGFYCWVRHPLYLFSIVILWLSPDMTVNLLTFYGLITLYFAIGSLHEERRLLAEFGDAYRDYQRQVPWLIPTRGRCYAPPQVDRSVDAPLLQRVGEDDSRSDRRETMPKTFDKGHAVVVGVGADLPVTVDDATAVAGLLRDPGRCAYPARHVELLTGENATARNVLAALDKLAASATPDSTAVVYFSGHGLEVPDYYLMPYGYNLNDLDGTAIPGDLFTEKLRAIGAGKLLVLLDCCHAGGQAEAKDLPGVKSPLPAGVAGELARGEGRVVIASSRKDEKSWVMPGHSYSAFTGALMEGLAGYGAFERDGYARVLDVALWVGRMVPDRTKDRQHPILKVSNLENNFALAYYAAGGEKPKALDWAPTVPTISDDLAEEEVENWRRRLASRREALMLIRERIDYYVEYEAVPLQLIKSERRTEKQIAELERKLGLRA